MKQHFCENCDKVLKKYLGTTFLGLICGLTCENINEDELIPLCQREKENSNNNE